MYNPVKTIKTNTVGTVNMLGLAKRTKARILIASTSEVYGDPEVHPQPESYWGHVNPIGPRACYDEGKRVAETLAYAYEKQSGVEVWGDVQSWSRNIQWSMCLFVTGPGGKNIQHLWSQNACQRWTSCLKLYNPGT